MGKPSPTGVEQANQVSTWQFTNIGTTTPILLYGSVNFFVWGTVAVSTTATSGSGTASISTNAGLIAGQSISSTNLPVGTTVGSFTTNVLAFSFAPGFTNGNITSGGDANASFTPASWTGSVQVERSFDGGNSFVICNIGGGGTGAIYASQGAVPISSVISEPERGMLYRFNLTNFTNGTVNTRFSASGLAAMAWGVPPG